jgi:hypothetical protein
MGNEAGKTTVQNGKMGKTKTHFATSPFRAFAVPNQSFPFFNFAILLFCTF